MNNKFSYFYITSLKNLRDFEDVKNTILLGGYSESTKFIEQLMLKYKEQNYDSNFLKWISDNVWLSSLEISNKLYSAMTRLQELKYSFTLINELFCFYNLLPIHKGYSFVKHGYPVNLDLDLGVLPESYVIYKEDEEFYYNVIINDTKIIHGIIDKIGEFSELKFLIDLIELNADSVIVLQSKIDDDE